MGGEWRSRTTDDRPPTTADGGAEQQPAPVVGRPSADSVRPRSSGRPPQSAPTATRLAAPGERGLRLPSRAVQIRAAVVVVVALAALVALASQLLGGWERSAQTLAEADHGWLALSLLLTLAYIGSGGVGWWLTLAALGTRLPFSEGIRLF